MNKLLTIFLLFGFNVHAQKEINVTELNKKITQITEEFMKENKFIGIQTAVLYKNDIIFHKGFGYADIENKRVFSNNTIVALGSNTKEFTSTAIQLLKNKGLISFDDTYLGAKSTAPSADNDGDSLSLGSLYFDTSQDVLRVYTGSGWSSVTSSGQYLPLSGGTLTGDLSLSNNSFNNFLIDAGNY